MPKRYAVYVNGNSPAYVNGKSPAQRLGTLTALDRPTAIKKATEQYDIPKFWLDVVLVMPRKLKRLKVRGEL
jgi:hypothetical protein